MVIPAFIMQFLLKGELVDAKAASADAVVSQQQELTDRQRKTVFWIGVGGLVLCSCVQESHKSPAFRWYPACSQRTVDCYGACSIVI